MKYASALCLFGISAFAQIAFGQTQDGQPPEAAACAALKHKGDPGAAACYDRLTRSNNPAVMAEGLWAAGNFKAANEAFRAASKLREKDPAPRTRWGRMYLDHWQKADAADLFQEALKKDQIFYFQLQIYLLKMF